ncbi:MAG: hypothetical protein FWG02_06740 [Holophagaceae bacterium]|nr:hypothetical protein [Holophagaceae bacterium]
MNIKKLLIFGVIGLVLMAVAGAGVYFLLQKSSGDSHNQEQPSELEQIATESTKPPEPTQPKHQEPVYEAYNDADDEEDGDFKLVAADQKHYITPLPGGSRTSGLRVEISIIIRDEELGKALTSETQTPEKAKAQSIVLDTLSVLELADVVEYETRLTVAQDIKDKLNVQFKPKPSTDKKAPPRPKRPIKEVLIVAWATQQ